MSLKSVMSKATQQAFASLGGAGDGIIFSGLVRKATSFGYDPDTRTPTTVYVDYPVTIVKTARKEIDGTALGSQERPRARSDEELMAVLVQASQLPEGVEISADDHLVVGVKVWKVQKAKIDSAGILWKLEVAKS